jgi:Domain of unknown function (DUF5710)
MTDEPNRYSHTIFEIVVTACQARGVLPTAIELPWPTTPQDHNDLRFFIDQVPDHFQGTATLSVLVRFDSPLCDKRNNRNQPSMPATTVNERLDLDVPFEEKDEAKRLGAQWDWVNKVWFVPTGYSVFPFERWLPGKKMIVFTNLRNELMCIAPGMKHPAPLTDPYLIQWIEAVWDEHRPWPRVVDTPNAHEATS